MAYNNNKGPQHTGDIQYEGDPNDVQIDFENDQIILRTGGAPRLNITNTLISGSGIYRIDTVSASADVYVTGAVKAASFYGSGIGLTSIPATAIIPAGSDTQIQFNEGGTALGASANLIWDDTNFKVVGFVSASQLLQGNGASLVGADINIQRASAAGGFAPISNPYIYNQGYYSGSKAMHNDGAVTLGSTLAVSGTTTLNGTLTVNAQTKLNSSLSSAFGAHFQGSSTFGSNVHTTGSVKTSGSISASLNLELGGVAYLSNNLNVTGAVLSKQTISGALGVNGGALNIGGESSFKVSAIGALSSSNTVRTVGSISSSGDLAVTGAVHGASFHGDGSGLTGLSSAAIANYNGAVDNRVITAVNANTVQGEANLTFGDPGSTGTDTLKVVGIISSSNTLQAVGNTLLGAQLKVTGAAQFASPVTASRGVNFNNTNASASFGGGAQLQIYYNGSNSVIAAEADHLNIRNNAVDKNIRLRMGDNAGATKVQFRKANDTNLLVIDSNGDVSGSGPLRLVGSLSSSGDLAVTGAVHASSVYSDQGLAVRPGTNFATVINGTQISSSVGVATVGSISSSNDLAVTGAVHAANFYGDGSGLTGIAGAASGSARLYSSTGVETSGYLKASGSATLAATVTIKGTGSFSSVVATGSISGSDGIYAAASISSSVNLAVTGAVHAANFYGNGSGLTAVSAISVSGSDRHYSVAGVETSGYLRVSGSTILGTAGADTTTIKGTGSFSDIVISGSVSGSSTIRTVGSISSSNDLAVTGAIHAANFYGDGSGLTGIAGAASGSARLYSSTGVETSGYLRVSGSITGSTGLHITGSSPRLAIGDRSGEGPQDGILHIRPSDTSNRMLIMAQAADHEGNRICFGVSGSGQVAVGGGHLGGVLNVSGSDIEKLISVKSDTKDPVFYLSASGEMYNSGSLTLKETEPYLYLSRSVSSANALIGINSSENILVQNNTNNRHIVFKCNDDGTIKEGLRLDGAVPEVVVNQGGTDFNNTLVNFRVESDNNTYMLYVKGANDAVGINNSDPKTDLDVHHNPTTLANDTGGGEAVKFGTGTTTTGKLYYLHSGSSWEQTDMINAASGGLGMLGIALGAAPATNGMLIRGFFDVHTYLSGAFVPGATVYISAPGHITTMRPSGSGEILRVLGNCTTQANVVYFNPSPDYLIVT